MTRKVEIMSEIRTEITSQLEALSTANHCGAGTLLIWKWDRELRFRISGTDRLACEVDSVQVCSAEFDNMSNLDLDSMADDLVKRLSYLEERLVVVEKDRLAHNLQLRSAKPVSSSNEKSYFELIAGRRGIRLHRFEKLSSRARQTVPFVLTRSVLIRLGHDLLEGSRTEKHLGSASL